MRIEPLPDVPTVAESGFRDFEAEVWFGVVAPAKTPKQTVSRLVDWFGTAVQEPEVKAKLNAQALYPVAKCGADFGAHIRRQFDEYTRVIREANINVE